MLTKINCDICGSKNYKKIWDDPPNVICKMCSFVFQNPRVQEKKVDSYYKHETLTSGSTYRDFKDGSFMFKLSHERLKFLKSNLPINTGSILDIGCNRGEFLSLFKNHEWTRYGIEPSKPAFEIAK